MPWPSARTAAGWPLARRTTRPGCGTSPTPQPHPSSSGAMKARSCRGLQPGRPLAGHRLLGQHGPAVERRRPRSLASPSSKATWAGSPPWPSARTAAGWLPAPMTTRPGCGTSTAPTAAPIVLRGHEQPVTAVAFSPDGRWLATGSDDNTARLWNVADPAAAPIVLRGHEQPCHCRGLQPGRPLAGHRLLRQHGPAVEHRRPRSRTHRPPGPRTAVSRRGLQPGRPLAGHRLLGQHGPAVERHRPRSPHPSSSGATKPVTAVAFSPDGRWLATGSWDNTARLWNVADPAAAPLVLQGHRKHDHCRGLQPGRPLAGHRLP